ncbi:hypothetical protein GQ53DRAFT_801048 [Thozetella sp. PMI_491]|nr:hypothetical protein GQ53DRAFT_801048 [Thozetella sp. PMI_491]
MAESPGAEKTLFLTGVTGFLGKVVLEGLIRRRQELGVAKVILLIRPISPSSKPGTAAEPRQTCRFSEVVSSECFANLPSDWAECVYPVYGDMEQPAFGLDPSVYEQISQEITHIIHCAACVQFDLPLAEAIRINVQGTRNVLELARACIQLEHLVYTSTAYVTPHTGLEDIYESLVPLGPWSNPEELMEDLSSGSVDEQEILRRIGHPNTYTLSKCIAEHVLADAHGKIPTTIVRPSIIGAAMERPFPAWTDSHYALAGVVLVMQTGSLYALQSRPDTDLDLVPVDFVAEFLVDETFETPPSSSLQIRHCVSGVKGLRPRTFSLIAASYFQHTPVRWLDFQHSLLARIRQFLWQDLLIYLMKFVCILTGDSRGLARLKRATQGLQKLNQTFGYFLSNTFYFVASRPTVQEKMPDFEVDVYIQLVFRGAQQYMMRRARQQNTASTERLIAGEELGGKSPSTMGLFATSRGGWAIRMASVIVYSALGRMFQKVTFDERSFYNALECYEPGLADRQLVILPSHRSFVDFVICPYLFYHFPGLSVKIPCIAAQDAFSKLPILGWLLRQVGAFYVQRGVGRRDPNLDSHVKQLVERDEHVMFFPEGQRSRSRQFLTLRRGLLRSLQSTGKPLKVLPISISYERVPEEDVFIRETLELEKSRMNVIGLFRWVCKMLVGRVKLGRVHIKCGKLLDLDPDTDVHSLSRDILEELQANTVVTTYHLESFVHHHQHFGPCTRHCPLAQVEKQPDGVKWLQGRLEERGATVLEGALSAGPKHPVSPILESNLRNQWIHFFEEG